MEETSETPPTKNLATKLVEIAAECRFVGKDSLNTFHKYKYTSAEALLSKVNEARTKRNIAVTTFADHQVVEPGHVIVTLRVTFINGDDPREQIMVTGIGEGKDTGDKATMKAMTAAHKYAYATGLGVSFGDDPEADESIDQITNSKPQQTKLKEMQNGSKQRTTTKSGTL